jgi:hypothetical protein
MTLSDLQVIFLWVSPPTIVILIILFWASYKFRSNRGKTFRHWIKDQWKSLYSIESVWIFLSILLILLSSSFFVVIAVQDDCDVFDYVSFAGPCAAGLIAGIGIVNKASRQLKQGKISDPFYILDYKYYIWSAILIFASFVIYAIYHFNVLSISYVEMAFSIACLAAYFLFVWLNQWRLGRGEDDLSKILVGAFLALMILALGIFIHDNKKKEWMTVHLYDCANKCENKGPNPKDTGGQYRNPPQSIRH